MGKFLGNPFQIQFSRVGESGKKYKMYELTNLGKKEVEQLEPEDTEFPIMSALHHKAMSADELSKESGLEPKKVEFMLTRLVAQGKVKRAEGN